MCNKTEEKEMAKADVVAMYNHQRMQERMVDLIKEYGQYASMDGTSEILETFDCNKGEYLIPMLSKHPNWDAENLHIVFSANYERQFDRKGIVNFVSWLEDIFKLTVCPKRAVKIDGISRDDYYDMLAKEDNYNDLEYYLKRAKAKGVLELNDLSPIGQYTYEEFKMERHRLNCEIANVHKQFESCYLNNHMSSERLPYGEYYNNFFKHEDLCAFDRFSRFVHYFKYRTDYPEDNKVTQEMLDKVKEIFPDLHTGVGTTITKLFRKIITKYYPELLEYSDTVTNSWYDDNGVRQTREKAVNIESKLSEMADMISPLSYRRHTVISVNPLDYLTMSFGHEWASCHTIDKHNRRGVRGDHYSGCYCSGTLSYMLDGATLIFYTVDEKYDGNEFEMEDKMQRCTFHINNDGNIIVQGRVYPDGRDGGDMSLAKQFREVMQKVISDCTEQPNFWTVKKGTGECGEYVRSYGTHYRDYDHYEDCTVSVRQNVITEYNRISVGHDPIDPDTGEEHDDEKYLNGDRDSEYIEYCDRCETRIDTNRDEYYYCGDNDCYYCCLDCAEEDDVHYCVDDYELHTESYCYQDAYNGNWYSGDPEIVVDDGSGRCYHSWETAENDGYIQTSDGEWYPSDEVYYDSYSDEYFHEDEDTVYIGNGDVYMCEENAEMDGYHCIDGEWYHENELVEVDGEWYLEDDDRVLYDEWVGENFIRNEDTIDTVDGLSFINEENAREMGYVLNNGEWIMSDTDNNEEIVSENNSENNESEVA